jgi:hypothetical protein
MNISVADFSGLDIDPNSSTRDLTVGRELPDDVDQDDADEIKIDEANLDQAEHEFSRAEIRALQSNDAMAAGVIATILGFAFLALLTLAISVSVWTMQATS